MLPPFECCLLNSILHDDFNMGYYFCPHRVAHFILQSINNFFDNREQAASYVAGLNSNATVREANLEDVFIELTGRRVND